MDVWSGVLMPLDLRQQCKAALSQTVTEEPEKQSIHVLKNMAIWKISIYVHICFIQLLNML